MNNHEMIGVLEVIGSHQVVLPSATRRLGLLAFVCVLGILAAFAFPAFAGYLNALLVVLLLALLAGMSALWSP
ncbi:MAG TPA: hypothetical protein VLM38_06100 [Blastocatellia bacterium]|nr:hypothetical protein [Blastocatellia bacterium]